MKVTWNVTGTRATIRRFERFEKDTLRRLRSAVARAATQVKNLARTKVPVSKVSEAGHVHLIQTIVRRQYGGSKYIAQRIGSPAKYARYVEFLKKGRRRPTPYLYPAIEEVAPKFQADIERIVRQEEIKHSG